MTDVTPVTDGSITSSGRLSHPLGMRKGRPSETEQLMRSIADRYPPGPHRDLAFLNARRDAFQVDTVLTCVSTGSVVDIGGGSAAFSAGCSASGLEATVIDDFGDPTDINDGSALKVHRSLGVRIVNRDVIINGLGLDPGSVDVITSFDSMEHWHNSPKHLFAEIMRVLQPGGWFFLGVPNCVNLRKRITVPLGKGKWSAMADWYEQTTFRGHVREADVDDLLYIARDMKLHHVSVMGKNWMGYRSRYAWVRATIPFADKLVQRRPSLCSDLYLLGRKQG